MADRRDEDYSTLADRSYALGDLARQDKYDERYVPPPIPSFTAPLPSVGLSGSDWRRPRAELSYDMPLMGGVFGLKLQAVPGSRPSGGSFRYRQGF